MNRRKSFIASHLILIPCLLLSTVYGQERSFRLKASAEIGFLGVLDHKIQFSRTGTYFDYDDEGGQDNLYAVTRLSFDLFFGRHGIVFLYQPLSLATRCIPDRDIIVDDVTFESGTPMTLLYSFPFYRISYLYDLAEAEDREFSLGLSFQVRNATIEFASLDGTQFAGNRDVGPVPILKLRTRHTYKSGFWWGTEADGFYAPISYINGSKNEVIGAILDFSVRAGLIVNRKSELFFNIRYLGGGAVGTSEEEGPGDGYVRNWLHFIILSTGFSFIL